MSFVVIDTNVLMVANEDFPPRQVDEEGNDVQACIARLQGIQSGKSGEQVVLDMDDRLLNEYQQTLRSSQQPSTGHAFLQWLYQSGWDDAFCDRVEITCLDESEQVFNEFPDHAQLADFDVADRKFVATANAHAAKPSMPNGWAGNQLLTNAVSRSNGFVRKPPNASIRNTSRGSERRTPQIPVDSPPCLAWHPTGQG